MRKAERDFESFREHGDARALARVFDRTIGQLWPLAAHLAANRHDAEDLIQSTFLVAIERAGDWDAERPLLPWLFGLLAMRAREQRRARRRRPDPARLPEPAASDPAHEASLAELESELHAALARVPEKYREVVLQHLLQGKSPGEIAETLRLRPGMARMRLHRGLKLLRPKLPKGLSASGVALALSSAAQAQLRAQVLSALPTSAATAAAVIPAASILTSLGVLLMSKLFVTGSAVVLSGAALTWLLLSGPSSGESPGMAAGAPDALGQQVSADPLEEDALEGGAAGQGAQRQVTAASKHDSCTIRGQCVDAESGAPIAGATFELLGIARGRSERDAYIAKHGPIQWKHPAPVTTDHEGHFELQIRPIEPLGYVMTMRGTEHAPRVRRVRRLEPGSVFELGRIELKRGFALRGLLRDRNERALADTRIDFSLVTTPSDRESFAPDYRFRLRSSPVGHFAAKRLVEAGRYRIEVDGHEILEPTELRIGQSGPPVPFEIVTVPTDEIETIEGVVRDPAGKPIRGVFVDAVCRQGSWDDIVSSGRDGAFVLRKPEGRKLAGVKLRFSQQGYCPTELEEEVPWGTHESGSRDAAGLWCASSGD